MKYIIGNGISGLIWKYYHPDFQIIAPSSAGGVYAKSHLVWIHDSPETRSLIRHLNIPYTLKQSRIGHYINGWIVDNTTEEEDTKLIQHKMSEWYKPLNTEFKPRDKKLSLSTGSILGKKYMNTIDVDLEEIIIKLNEHADVMNGLVTQIDNNKIFVQTSKEEGVGVHLEYDMLISTIPAPFFWRAWGTTKEFRCIPITNIIVKNKPKEFDDRYEMIYYDRSVPFSRVSFLKGKYALEFSGVITKEEFQEKYPDLEVLEYFVVPQGRIFETENYPPNEKIIFSGRFSQWVPGIVTENIISRAINYNEK